MSAGQILKAGCDIEGAVLRVTRLIPKRKQRISSLARIDSWSRLVTRATEAFSCGRQLADQVVSLPPVEAVHDDYVSM